MLAYDARAEARIVDKIVVVADFGGTRSDVAVIASRGGMYSILSTAHDYETVGTQLDQVLIDHFAKEFIKKHKTDPRKDKRSLAKLKIEAEATKKSLSIGGNASLSVESLADGIDFSSTINRTRYELLASKVLGAFTRLIEEAIRKADLDILDIDEVHPPPKPSLHPVIPQTNHMQVILSGGTSHTPRLTTSISRLFPPTTTILSPVTTPSALNPSELCARGAAIQASLISDYDPDDISQSTHPAVTATPHLQHAIGVLVVSEDANRGVFKGLLERETAVPCRRAGVFAVPGGREAGDVIVKVCEGVREIKVSKAEKKPMTNGKSPSDDESEDEDEEVEVTREKVWRVGTVLAEAAVRGVKKGGKVEVTVNVCADLVVQVTAREVGGKGGVRGQLEKRKVMENGIA